MVVVRYLSHVGTLAIQNLAGEWSASESKAVLGMDYKAVPMDRLEIQDRRRTCLKPPGVLLVFELSNMAEYMGLAALWLFVGEIMNCLKCTDCMALESKGEIQAKAGPAELWYLALVSFFEAQ